MSLGWHPHPLPGFDTKSVTNGGTGPRAPGPPIIVLQLTTYLQSFQSTFSLRKQNTGHPMAQPLAYVSAITGDLFTPALGARLAHQPGAPAEDARSRAGPPPIQNTEGTRDPRGQEDLSAGRSLRSLPVHTPLNPSGTPQKQPPTPHPSRAFPSRRVPRGPRWQLHLPLWLLIAPSSDLRRAQCRARWTGRCGLEH